MVIIIFLLLALWYLNQVLEIQETSCCKIKALSLILILCLHQKIRKVFSFVSCPMCTRGSSIAGFVDDYAWMVRGFLSLYETTLDCEWLELAEQLQDKQNELFWDKDGAGYFMTQPGDDSILLRIKEGAKLGSDVSEGLSWIIAFNV